MLYTYWAKLYRPVYIYPSHSKKFRKVKRWWRECNNLSGRMGKWMNLRMMKVQKVNQLLTRIADFWFWLEKWYMPKSNIDFWPIGMPHVSLDRKIMIFTLGLLAGERLKRVHQLYSFKDHEDAPVDWRFGIKVQRWKGDKAQKFWVWFLTFPFPVPACSVQLAGASQTCRKAARRWKPSTTSWSISRRRGIYKVLKRSLSLMFPSRLAKNEKKRVSILSLDRWVFSHSPLTQTRRMNEYHAPICLCSSYLRIAQEQRTMIQDSTYVCPVSQFQIQNVSSSISAPRYISIWMGSLGYFLLAVHSCLHLRCSKALATQVKVQPETQNSQRHYL